MIQSCDKIEYRNKNAINYDKVDIARNINKKSNKYNLNYKIMKKFRVLSSVLASALMMTMMSCSSSDDLNGGGADAESSVSYIAVNIKNVGTASTGSRADYTQGSGTYEDGTANEGAISKVRFFFFNTDGSPYLMKGKTVNYKELNAAKDGTVDNLHTIEGKTSAMLVIEGETKTAPAYMIAVVNPQTLTNLKDDAYRE